MMPQTENADNNETDIKADASTNFLFNIKPIATVGQTGPGNANMELHLITRRHLQLNHKQRRGYIKSRANISSLITRKHGVAFDHEQTSPAWPRASMELHLIMSKHI